MLLTDEQYVIKWLSQYGPLPKAQVVRLLRDKSPTTAERLLNRMKRDQRIADVGDGYYLGLDPYCTPDQRVILAVWVLLQFIDRVEPLAHYPATYPSQLFFLKENTGYEIVVLYEGEQHLAKLLHPQEDLKYPSPGALPVLHSGVPGRRGASSPLFRGGGKPCYRLASKPLFWPWRANSGSCKPWSGQCFRLLL